MVAFVSRGLRHGVFSLRALALFGTALSGLASPALAEKLVFNGAGDFSVTRADTLTDVAPVVDVRTTNGNLNLDFGTLNVTAASSGPAAALFGHVTGTGDIQISTSAVTVAPGVKAMGIVGQGNGATKIVSGTVTAVDGSAILASGNSVDIISTSARASGQNQLYSFGITDSSNTAAIFARGDTGGVRVKAEETVGLNGRGGITAVSTTGSIAVESGRVSTDSINTTAISATGVGSISVKSDSITAAGTHNANGIFARDGSLSTAPLATNMVIDSGSVSISNGNGILVDANLGSVSVKSGSVSTLGYVSSAIRVSAKLASVNVASQTITTAGQLAHGIDISSGGSVDIQSGTIKTTGPAATAIKIDAPARGVVPAPGIKVTSDTIVASGDVSTGIGVSTDFAGRTDAIDIKSQSITMNGTASYGIQVLALGAVNISSDKIKSSRTAISTIGFGSSPNAAAHTIVSKEITGSGHGIAASNSGAINIDSGSIALTSTASTATALDGNAINASVSGAANLTVKSGSIQFTGTGNTNGITAIHGGTSGALTVDSGSISVVGNGGYGILTNATAATTRIVSQGDITTTGTTRAAGGGTDAASQRYADGIVAISSAGSVVVTNRGTISTAGSAARGISVEAGRAITTFSLPSVTPSTATLAVSNSGTVKTAGANAHGINIQGDNGTATIGSKAVITTGAGAEGIRVTTNEGSINVISGTTTSNDNAIHLTSALGGITLDSQTATSAGASGAAILVNAGGAANVTSGTASAVGDGFSAVRVTGGTGVKLAVGSATSSGATVAVGNETRRGDAVFATATGGAIEATIGSAKATGAGADAVRLIANGTGGAVSVNVTGTLESTSGHGLFIDPPGAVTVAVAKGGNLSGGLAGLSTESATVNMIDNAGTIRRSGTTTGAAIIALGKTTLSNAGTIAGIGETAVQLGATDDSVTLQTGSVVQGAIDGSGGSDVANLSGSIATPTATQTMARFANFETLNVNGGYWTASEAASSFNSVNIASGAALELANSGTALSGVSAPAIVNNGTLVVRSSGTGTSGTFGSAAVSGTGSVALVGTGTVVVDNANLTYSGATTVGSGSTLLLTGTLGTTVATEAGGIFQLGNGGTTGSFTGNLINNGTFDFNRTGDYTLTGAVSGAGNLVKRGDGTLILTGDYSFTGITSVLGGSIRIGGQLAETTELDLQSGQVDLSGTRQTVAALAGASASASLNIAGGALTVNQSTNTSFAGSIVGTGSLTKTGAGTLTLSGVNTYSGPTSVNGGTLAVNGRIASPVIINAGGRLGGTGTVASVAAAAQGTVAPGNSIGTLNVAGPVTFAAGSAFEVEVNADGRSDQIVATGPAALAGTVAVVTEPGTFGKITDYAILTASSVTGQFAGATTSSATLVPFLTYGPTGVRLTLARTDLSFGAIATTANQRAVAASIEARGVGDPVFNSVLRLPTSAAGQAAFDALSGELYASVPTALVDQSRLVRGALLDRSAANDLEGAGAWGQAFDSLADGSGDRGVAEVDAGRRGVIAGVDYGGDGWRLGAAAGIVEGDIDVDARASTADVETKLVGVYGRADLGRIAASAGGSYEWHDIEASRTVGTTGLAGEQTAGFDGSSWQLFGELSYALMTGPIEVSPFVGVATVHTRTDGFAETGTAAALTVDDQERDVSFGTFGFRMGGFAQLGSSVRLLPRFSIAYRQAWGDREGVSRAGFAGTPTGFTVAGARLGRSGVDLDGGLEVGIGERVRLGASYAASSAGDWSDHGARITASLAF